MHASRVHVLPVYHSPPLDNRITNRCEPFTTFISLGALSLVALVFNSYTFQYNPDRQKWANITILGAPLVLTFTLIISRALHSQCQRLREATDTILFGTEPLRTRESNAQLLRIYLESVDSDPEGELLIRFFTCEELMQAAIDCDCLFELPTLLFIHMSNNEASEDLSLSTEYVPKNNELLNGFNSLYESLLEHPDEEAALALYRNLVRQFYTPEEIEASDVLNDRLNSL